MSRERLAILGVQPCGCITYANSRPDTLGRDGEKVLADILRRGGCVVRVLPADARADPNFLPDECPHDPKGWERTPYVAPIEFRGYRSHYTVYRSGKILGFVNRIRATGLWEAARRGEVVVGDRFKTRTLAAEALVEVTRGPDATQADPSAEGPSTIEGSA